MEEHQARSRAGANVKFRGGLADTSELTIMGHTATHLLHKTLRNMFGEQLHQTGSNITAERIRFDYNYERMLTPIETKQIEDTVNEKIQENLPVHFEIMPYKKAKQMGAIGLFDEKYANDVKVYFIGNYSLELCGGPHVDFTGALKRFKIIKVENIGKGQKRIYAKVNTQI
jgi:alanyl-tRNA synthetase